MSAINVKDLSHTYAARGRKQPAREALKAISFQVESGAFFALLGPNGGGKSTTFQILATMLTPTSGLARIGGYNVVDEPEAVRRQLGVVFQNPSLDKKLTIEENLRHQGHLYGLSGSILRARIDEALVSFDLSDRRDDFVETLSGGLKRRVEIAKALLHEPRVLLLDEPTTGLDPAARRDVWDVLARRRKAAGLTVMVTTHLMEEADACDQVVILNEGVIVAQGSPAALKSEIGGDVITVDAESPDSLGERVAQKFQVPVRVIDGALRIEKTRGHEFIPLLVQAFPKEIRSIHLGKPSLEDVFIQRTGRTFA